MRADDLGCSRLSLRALLRWKAHRRYRFALRRVPLASGARVIDVGGAHGLFGSMLLAAGAAEVTVVERKRHDPPASSLLGGDPRLRFVHDDILSRFDLLAEADVVSALHCLHQLGRDVHALFDAIEDSPVRLILIQGSTSHEASVEPKHEEELFGPVLGLGRGMTGLLEAHGFSWQLHPHRRYPVAVGVR
jgi:hypothetical protein